MNHIWIMLIGALVASSCSLVGCFLVLRKMSMIGDAISHAILPGIVIAFLLSGTRDSFVMMIGAAVIGIITVFLIQMFQNNGVQSDASIGVVFTALFAGGVVLVSLFTRQVDLDLDCVLYGEIAYAPWDTFIINGLELGPKAVWIVGSIFLLNILVIGLFYKQFKLCSFDPAMAAALGIPVVFFHYLLMSLVSLTTVSSFESVGAILVVGMIIVPAATAYLLTDRLFNMIIYSMIAGIVSAILGYYFAYLMDASIAGCMIMVAGFLFLITLIASPKHGVLFKKWRRKKLVI
ncbi:metal ABC transporter permease [Heyndrickxia oleronia]|uniref:Metal ABC transporter permease n=1 Tax=Heyndrickxia oleronia TaxID=38875 RepID=A0AAW6SQU9_9BACI|nr:metal ABC transporter permease [Heyndrickxia oleronia]MDH5159632.1 metal ABC transporter permease [Heyndrickxia oleronia]